MLLFLALSCFQGPVMRGSSPMDVFAGAAMDAPHENRYHALLFGINQYKDTAFNNLGTPQNDVNALGDLLANNYGFVVTKILGDQATREEMLNALETLSSNAGQGDHLLIYFAGHGMFGQGTASGYWIPYDGETSRTSTFLNHNVLLGLMKKTKAAHVLVIADACYSGTFGHGSSKADSYDYKSRSLKRSRWVITSGGYQQVPDSLNGDQNFSPFAKVLMKILRDCEVPHLPVSTLLSQMRKVMRDGGYLVSPKGGVVGDVGDDEGMFYFWNQTYADEHGHGSLPPWLSGMQETNYLIHELRGRRVLLIRGRPEQVSLMEEFGLHVIDDRQALPRAKREVVVKCRDIDIAGLEHLMKMMGIQHYRFRHPGNEQPGFPDDQCGADWEITIRN